ncbi:nuclear transcription factor Y subunit C-2-like [Lotus japonicus]|uniref:nuclear transcription factor Y subunit C-2-like n=1 Tax=Lotus japonicus TaxID=34305 RepID=UPI0025862E00|nr:nuclear transcription factor Y subunit C-2-like [Lotus japonicus]
MDENQPEPEQLEGGEDTPAQEANVMHQSQPNQMTTHTQIVGGSSSSCYRRGQLYLHQHIHRLQQQQLRRRLNNFWETKCKEIENPIDFNHAFPLARIKKIMKADPNVNSVAADAPVLFSKVCEMFIMDLTMRAWMNAEENKRRTLQTSDIASAISRTEVFDFLVGIVPKDEKMEHDVYAGIPPRTGNDVEVVQNVPPPLGTTHPYYAEVVQNVPGVQNVPPPLGTPHPYYAEVVQNVPAVQNVPPPLGTPHPYYYVPAPPPHHFGSAIPPRMVMARPPFDHPIYRQQPPYPYAPQALQYAAPKHLMIENSPDSDETKK